MGNTITSLKDLQADRNVLKIPKKVMSSREATLNEEDLSLQKKEPDLREVNVDSGRHHKGMISIVFILLILVSGIALAIFLKGYISETGRIAARMDTMELSVSKNSDQIKAVYKDAQALKKEIDAVNIKIANIGSGNEQIKKAGALIRSEIDGLVKSQNTLYEKVNSLEGSLKTKQ